MSDAATPPQEDAAAGEGAAPLPDSSSTSAPDTGSSDEDAGITRNAACTPLSEQTGTIVDTAHGRLDGTLVYVLPLGGSAKCNGDDSHVHLQIEVSGEVYDVAVDIGAYVDGGGDLVGLYQDTLAVPGGAWSEGWHGTDALAYSSLGLHSTSFPTASPSSVASQLETLLASTDKISVFCTGYMQGNGCHDVHWKNGTSEDGAIVLDPTAATSPILFFRFENQTF